MLWLIIHIRNPCQSRLEPQLGVGERVFRSEPAEHKPVMIMQNECVRVHCCEEPHPRVTHALTTACKCFLVLHAAAAALQTHTHTHKLIHCVQRTS